MVDDMDRSETPSETRGRGSKGPDRNLWLGIIGVLLLVIIGMYIWREVDVRGVRGEAEERREALVERAELEVDRRTEELLRLSAIPLAWAVRTEMLRRDLGQVDGYLTEFVQERGVEQAVLAGARDTVLVATDRRLQGTRFSQHFPAELLERDQATVEPVEQGRLRVVVPIMGINRRLGTLVVRYRPEELRLEQEPMPAVREGG